LQIDDTVTDESLDQLYHFIDQLKPIDKALIILYLEGCKNKEISRVMGMSVTNVSTRKQRIKEALQYYFESLSVLKLVWERAFVRRYFCICCIVLILCLTHD